MIKINISNLEDNIAALKLLQKECNTFMTLNSNALILESKECVVNELKESFSEINDIESSLLLLLDNSIAFFENVKESYEDSDQTIADFFVNK